MKLFEILREIDAKKEPEEISVIITEEAIERLGLQIAMESVWTNSGYKDWVYRVDPENPSIPLMRHIHIAKQKHTSSKNMQASWNCDGTRHDKKSFNTKVGNLDAVRDLARNVLKISLEISLENHQASASKKYLTESISSSEDGNIAYVFFRIV